VKRYESGKNPVVTLLMLWHGQADLVIFNEYNGAFTFETLPSSPDNNWLLPTGLVNFIPKAACERFHINFWLGNYLNHPPPSSPQEGGHYKLPVQAVQAIPVEWSYSGCASVFIGSQALPASDADAAAYNAAKDCSAAAT
jgi:hypothetical protein